MSSWRASTKKQYSTYIERWLDFCGQRKITCNSPTLNQALLFLKMLFTEGLSYSTINTARSALSTIVCMPAGQVFGSHHIVVRFMKGVFELSKPKPKYSSIWDVSVVLKYLGTFVPNPELTLKQLTFKVVMLMLLVSGQRGQTIHSLSLDGMTLTETSCKFQVLEHLKTSKPGSAPTIIEIKAYTPDEKVCPMLALQEYLQRTESLRGEHKQLFISYIKPYLSLEIPYQYGSKLSLMMPELTQAYTQHTVPGLLPHPKHTVMLFH